MPAVADLFPAYDDDEGGLLVVLTTLGIFLRESNLT